MTNIEPQKNDVEDANDAEKKLWVTPVATIEQISTVTKAGSTPNPDGLGCSS